MKLVIFAAGKNDRCRWPRGAGAAGHGALGRSAAIRADASAAVGRGSVPDLAEALTRHGLVLRGALPPSRVPRATLSQDFCARMKGLEFFSGPAACQIYGRISQFHAFGVGGSAQGRRARRSPRRWRWWLTRRGMCWQREGNPHPRASRPHGPCRDAGHSRGLRAVGAGTADRLRSVCHARALCNVRAGGGACADKAALFRGG